MPASGTWVGAVHSPSIGHFYCTQHLLGECPSRSPALYMTIQSRVTNCCSVGPMTMYYEDATVVCMPL